MTDLTTNGKRWQGSKWIRPAKRLAIYLRDKMRCVYCDAPVIRGTATTLDHIVPRIDGGSNSETNLVTACKACNDSKNGSEVGDFLKRKFGRRKAGILKRVTRQTALDLTPFLEQAKGMLSSPENDE